MDVISVQIDRYKILDFNNNILWILWIVRAKNANRSGPQEAPTLIIIFDGGGGGGVTPLRAPTPLCQNRVCLTRGVSPGAYRGAQGRSLKNTWKMFVFNCIIHFVTCIVTIFPITELLGYP